MPSFTKGTIVPGQPQKHSNAFTTSYLGRLAERDEPPTAGDADVTGPWRIGTGRDPLLLLSKQPDAHGAYPVALAGGGDDGNDGDGGGPGGPVGFFQLFDEKSIDALNVVVHLLQAPESRPTCWRRPAR